MTTDALFRAAAIAWIATALARVAITLGGLGPANVSPTATLVSAVVGIAAGAAGAWLLLSLAYRAATWRQPRS